MGAKRYFSQGKLRWDREGGGARTNSKRIPKRMQQRIQSILFPRINALGPKRGRGQDEFKTDPKTDATTDPKAGPGTDSKRIPKRIRKPFLTHFKRMPNGYETHQNASANAHAFQTDSQTHSPTHLKTGSRTRCSQW